MIARSGVCGCQPVCAPARALPNSRGETVFPPAERGSQPAPQVARAAGPVLPSRPPAACLPTQPLRPPAAARSRPAEAARDTRAPRKSPLSALPHLSRLPRVTRTAWSPSRPLPLQARVLSVARSGSQLSRGWKRWRLQVPHPPEQRAHSLIPDLLDFFRCTSPEGPAVAF